MPYSAMTRPRMLAREFSWRVELPVIMKTMLQMPMGTRTMSSDQKVGAADARTEAAPKATAATARRRGFGSCWRAMANAPRSDPTPRRESIVA